MTAAINSLLSLLTIIAQIIVVGGIILHFLAKDWLEKQPFHRLVQRHAILFAGIVALTATLGSLFYSEIAGYTPCKLCWFQRIFMYPLVLLLGIAWQQKDRLIWRYVLPMSVGGGLIALYHYYLQLGGNPLIPCTTVGYSVNCAQRFVMKYGYITIPMMALSAFALISFFMLHLKKQTTTK